MIPALAFENREDVALFRREKRRRAWVLSRMRKSGYITAREETEANQVPIRAQQGPAQRSRPPGCQGGIAVRHT